jgi:hypothetical protein
MTKILVRAHTNIMEAHSIDEVLAGDLFGHNPGNWLFQYGVLRTIANDDVEIGFINGYSENLTLNNIKKLNETYDMFLMPLANVFKKDWVDKLRSLTFLVKRLEMPCIVIGIGLQADAEDDNFDFSFNNTAKNFIDAVLSKSSIIGIRGEYTARYFEYLGYVRDKDFMVIGCPSMYSFGMNLKKIKPGLPDAKNIIINTNPDIKSDIYNEWLENYINKLNSSGCSYYYIPQRLDELRLIRYGTPLSKGIAENAPDYFPTSVDKPMYAHEVGINSVEAWLNFTSQQDFTVGTRIHGCIVSILSGVPALVIAKDTRMAELADFFNIPYVRLSEITTDFNPVEYCKNVDYSKIYASFEEKFKGFLHFLDQNNVPHIYNNDIYRTDFPYDKFSKANSSQIYFPISSENNEDSLKERVINYLDYLQTFARSREFSFRKRLVDLYNSLYKQEYSTLSMKNKRDAANSEIKVLNENISELKVSHSKEVNELQLKLEDEANELSELQQLISKLSEENKSLNNSISELSAENSELKHELRLFGSRKYTLKHFIKLFGNNSDI